MTNQKKVLILCTGNSARSQMAEGLLRHLGGDSFCVNSAGVAPTHIRPEAINVMNEIGIDISTQYSKAVDRFVTDSFDYIITVCDNANERCPIFPGRAERIHWDFEDPVLVEGDEAARLNAFRKARDQIRGRLEKFIESARR